MAEKSNSFKNITTMLLALLLMGITAGLIGAQNVTIRPYNAFNPTVIQKYHISADLQKVNVSKLPAF